jgi:TolB protein
MNYITLTILSIFFIFNAHARDNLVVSQGTIAPTPIAINIPSVSDANTINNADKIRDILEQDLKSTGLFKSISKNAFIEKKIGINHKPLFAAWQQINATYLINMHVSESGGKTRASFILFDSYTEQKVLSETFEINTTSIRRLAHKIADRIFYKITGDIGHFDTKVVYVAEMGPLNNRVRRLAIMDYDGENHKFLTDGQNLVMTPRISPNGDKLLYVLFPGKHYARIMMKDLYTGREVRLGDFKGMSFAPRFSPDGKKLLVSVAKNGATNIAEIDVYSKKMRFLTKSNSINTSPSYSPDGERIVFNSDRSGSRQLYIMDKSGENVKQITYLGSYAAPEWSPRGDYIAFIKLGDPFSLGVIKPDGSGERIITSDYLIDMPSWSPNGRFLIYTKATRPTKVGGFATTLYFIDVTGYNEKRIKTPYFATSANWSTLQK